MDWLKLLSYMISSIAIALSLNARLKRFNNERISVYKDMKALSSELKMESHEIKLIDDELKQLILREVTGVFEVTPARRLMKVLSCNPNLDAVKKKRLKTLIRCVNENEYSTQNDGGVIKLELNKGMYNKRSKEGAAAIIAFFVCYLTFLFSGYSSIIRGEYYWAGVQIIMTFVLLIAMVFAKVSYPALWNYRSHKRFIDKLNECKVH